MYIINVSKSIDFRSHILYSMHYLPILGISLSSLLLLLTQNVYIYQPFDSYIYTIPVITFCVAKFFLKPELKFQEWGGLLCMVPALGYMASKYAIAIHDLAYLSWQQGVAHLLRIFYVSTEGVYLILDVVLCVHGLLAVVLYPFIFCGYRSYRGWSIIFSIHLWWDWTMVAPILLILNFSLPKE